MRALEKDRVAPPSPRRRLQARSKNLTEFVGSWSSYSSDRQPSTPNSWQTQQTTAGKKKTFKKKEKKVVPQGIVHIQASFNNTLISITDLQGNLVVAVFVGCDGLSRLAQGNAVCRAAGRCQSGGRRARQRACASCEVRVKGPGSGRESAIRAIQAAGIDDQVDSRCDADSAQRLPSTEAAPSVSRKALLVEAVTGAVTAGASITEDRDWQEIEANNVACAGAKG